jgi:hypothetical protein
MTTPLICMTALAALLVLSAPARAEDYVLTLKDNQFAPQQLVIPAKQKVKITVKNLDATPAEFESYELNREKVVAAHSEIIVFVGPLDPGNYNFFDDFHRDTTKGVITAK